MFQKDAKIAVIGDVMLDKHVSCEVIGLSPEDDIALKIRITSERKRPGGAANVVLNLRTLGCMNAHLISIVGNDQEGKELTQFMTNGVKPSLCICEDRPTITKTRYVSPTGKHIVRIDKEKTKPINTETTNKLIEYLEENAPYDAIIVSDYNKGVISKELCVELHSYSPLIIVDPKGNDLTKYGVVYAITPNEKEWGDGKKHKATNLIVTRGRKGCSIDMGKVRFEWPVRAREVGDPTGCGDSFIAGMTMALVSNLDINRSCNIGMAVAACSVDHEGAYAVSVDELKKELASFTYF